MADAFEIRAGVLTACHPAGTALYIPGGVRVIGEGALRGMTGIREVFLPEGVEKIEQEAFLGCTGLEAVHFPDSLREIHFGAFCGCTRLRAPEFPGGLRFIDRQAFQECARIHCITIPPSVETVGFSAFRGCGLERVEMEERDFTHFYDVEVLFLHGLCPCCRRPLLTGRNGMACCECILSAEYVPFTRESVREWTESAEQYFPYFTHASSMGLYDPFPPEGEPGFLIRCCEPDEKYRGNPFPHPGRLEIVGSVTCIPDGLFQGWTELRELKLRSGVEEIGDNAFAGCENLTTLWIPSTVIRIGENAFANCTRLTTVYFSCKDGMGLEEIGSGAFFGCKALASIHLPGTVTRLGVDAFKRCPGLESACLPPALEELDLERVFPTDGDGELTTEIRFGDDELFTILCNRKNNK